MADNMLRRSYPHNAILIESARVLASPYADAVVYLTGAQIELLRNVTYYLNRRGTYAASYALGYYMMPTDEDYDDILEIVADLEETLMGNPNTIWGYDDRLAIPVSKTVDGSSPYDVETDAVPAGEVWVVRHATASHNQGADRTAQFFVHVGADVYYTTGQMTIVSGTYHGGLMHITLKEGDKFSARFWGLDNLKQAHLRLNGYKMVVPT